MNRLELWWGTVSSQRFMNSSRIQFCEELFVLFIYPLFWKRNICLFSYLALLYYWWIHRNRDEYLFASSSKWERITESTMHHSRKGKPIHYWPNSNTLVVSRGPCFKVPKYSVPKHSIPVLQRENQLLYSQTSIKIQKLDLTSHHYQGKCPSPNYPSQASPGKKNFSSFLRSEDYVYASSPCNEFSELCRNWKSWIWWKARVSVYITTPEWKEIYHMTKSDGDRFE